MTRLTQKAQTSITVKGREYQLKTDFRNALLTWEAFTAHHDGELSNLATAIIAFDCMLGVDIEDVGIGDRSEVLQAIADYLNKHSRPDERSKNDNKPPLLCLDKDSTMLYDAFQSMGIDLDSADIAYPRFMSLLRELPKNAQICRIVYLRQQHRANKLTKEEKAECNRRGWEIIKFRTRQQEKAGLDNKEHFKQVQNAKRAAKGLPPI